MAVQHARWGVEIVGGLEASPGLIQSTTFDTEIAGLPSFEGYRARAATVLFDLELQPNPEGGFEAFATATDAAGAITFEISLEGSARGSFIHPLEFDGSSGGGGTEGLGTMAEQDADDVDITGGVISGVTLINVTVDGGWFP